MTSRLIYVVGCDDATAVVLDLTDDEYAVAQRIATAVTEASEAGCQPTIQTATEGEPHHGWPQDPEEY